MLLSVNLEAMSKTLADIKNLYLDSNILIYLIEGNKNVAGSVISAFNEIDEFGINLVTSEITLTECFHGPFRDDNEQLAEEYGRLFSQENFIQQIPANRDILIEAARIAGLTKLKTVDAVHFATAEHFGCDGFLTNDRAFRSSGQVKVIQLSEFKT